MATTSIGDVFNKQLAQLREYAKTSADTTKVTAWYQPADFDSPLFDWASMTDVFSRKQQEDEFRNGVSQKDLTLGDLSMVQVQGDVMQSLERAFRARHHGICRNRAHAAGRLQAHGHANGSFTGLLGYVEWLDQLNKGASL